MKKDYKFSIIVPIYNVGKYLEETIMSVVNQTIGFENIQLILINDGSIDNSEEICLKYQKIYPENIIYYKQKNSGVSAARNKGLELATGELVNFFDGDDIWDKHAFKEVYKNYKRNKDVQIYSCKLLFFDAKKGKWLNTTFADKALARAGAQVVDTPLGTYYIGGELKPAVRTPQIVMIEGVR